MESFSLNEDLSVLEEGLSRLSCSKSFFSLACLASSKSGENPTPVDLNFESISLSYASSLSVSYHFSYFELLELEGLYAFLTVVILLETGLL